MPKTILSTRDNGIGVAVSIGSVPYGRARPRFGDEDESKDYKGDTLQYGFKVHKQSGTRPFRTRQGRIGILRSIWTRGPLSLHIGGRMILALFFVSADTAASKELSLC